MIQLKNVSVKYKNAVALQPVSLDIKDSQFTVLLGSSGAGKSTFLRCLNLMNPLASGYVKVTGFDGKWRKRSLQMLRRETGMIFQQHQLIERETALQNVLMGRLGYHSFLRTLFPLSAAEQELGLLCLKRVGLLDKALCRVDQLSGGQQQRVGIARVLAQQPKTILADEPVASLDPATADKVLNLIHTICKEDGISAVVSLHQVDLARKYADRIIGLAGGRVVFDGVPEELSERQVEALYQNRLTDSRSATVGQLMNVPLPFIS